MAWTTPASLRTVLGITSTELSDSDANDYIAKAQEAVRRDLAEYIKDDVLVGAINGTNTKFLANYTPIGDGDFDLDIDKDDVAVYGWTDVKDENSKVQLDVAKLSPNTGLIELVSPPDTSYVQLTATYYRYWAPLNTKLYELCTNYLAAYLYLINQYAFAPLEMALGSMRVIYRGGRGSALGVGLFPYTRFWNEYVKLVALLKSQHTTRTEADDMEVREPILIPSEE